MVIKRNYLTECIIILMGSIVISFYRPVQAGSWSTPSEKMNFFISSQSKIESKGAIKGTFSEYGTSCNSTISKKPPRNRINISLTSNEPITSSIDTVNIIDTNFLSALVEMGVDENGDNVISHSEAEAIINLGVSFRDISDMTKIEAFVNLESLYCIGNQLTNLDVSNCSSLTLLDCGFNQLINLDLSSNSDLTVLYCGWNQLVNLDVSNSEYLVNLDCGFNQLTNLDMSNNTLLNELYCGWNLLSNLEVNNNNALKVLYCTDNELTSLDVSNNVLLHELYCGWNHLTELEVANCISLIHLDCSGNELIILDVSNHTLLNELYCSWNRLSNLEVVNNSALIVLHCSGNRFNNLDISNNASLEILYIEQMPYLYKVCVWTMPFPPDSFELLLEGSPQIFFTFECGDLQPPELDVTESDLYQPEFISAISSEDGVVYLVPENTISNLQVICGACLDSVPAVAEEIVYLSPDDLANGNYWLYARDNSNNISDPKEFTIDGVGVGIVIFDDLRIYPNPANDIITINTNQLDKCFIEIITLNGKVLYNYETSDPICRIDFSSFKKGIYLITIRSKDFVTTEKIIKL